MIKSKFSISLHILTLLAHQKGQWLSSSYIAKSLNVNPVLVRKEIANLKAGGFIESKEGKNGGVKLLKKATKIALSDIFKLAKGDENVLSLSRNTPNADCPIGKKINNQLELVLNQVDDSILSVLKQQTLEDFKNKF
ncbi:Rrf2 family transcriptional regulator [Wenyingzhuangia sp. 1_MG-2023]|nr:Rrf2 family transcriptional regulator [Wenyingzhuangia sp. 1_MG-2023]